MSEVVTHNVAAAESAASLGLALGRRSVVLVGMMGAGKSSVGRRLAARLGIPFVDADAEIEKAAGMTIAEIFSTHGEDYFRAGEMRVIARLLDSGPQVLATGGGAFMNAETRAAIRAKGISVWLRATIEVLVRRVKRRGDRPLLKTADPVETLQQLMDERYPIYAESDVTVESRDVPHETIVDEIVEGLRGCAASGDAAGGERAMTAPLRSIEPITVNVALGDRAYDIAIGRGLLATLGERIGKLRPGSKAAIVTDDAVARHHLAAAQEAIKSAGIVVSSVKVPAGESSKSFRMLEQVCDALLAGKLERGDLVVALGGGVVGDLAGFAASVVRRGVDYVQVPTSLLAQVDSSVGGKTAIDTRQGKNLIGAFYQPILVVADTALLDTLPEREFRSGYAEVVKYGLLGDAAFYDWLEANWRDLFSGGPAREHAIAVSCRAKAAIVARDERETGDRMLLNLGHTFGHAFEAAAGFSDRLLHGEAIGLGMALAFEFSARRGLIPQADADRVISHLAATGLPTHVKAVPGGNWPGIDAMMDLISQDKKVQRGQLTFILVRGIGQAFVSRDVDAAEVRSFLAEKLGAR